MKLHLKIIIFLFLFFFFFSLFLYIGNIYYENIHPIAQNIKIGVSFSSKRATDLGLDWRKTYLSILNDLDVKYIRLNSYWSEIEPAPSIYYFNDLDFMLAEASKHQTKIILVVGAKQPVWPECYTPDWAKSLSLDMRRQKTLDLIENLVNRYKSHSEIWRWQVENEPLVDFGVGCDPTDRTFLKQEVDLVKKIDPSRPIIITDSGELRAWRTPMQLSNIFGTTIYRKVYTPILGYFNWPIPPTAYHLKSDLVRLIFAQNNDKTIISELQAEVWLPNSATNTPLEEQVKNFSADDLRDNIEYAKKTGFDEIFLWGAEWWYFMAKMNHPEYLKEAQKLFKINPTV